jgi:ADP-ribose pyrophosphatase YjhB (NUDIX family)
MKLVLMAGACVVWNRKTLLLQQSKKGRHPGKWGMPGGRLKKGESLVDGALREVKEETNLDIEIKGLIETGVKSHPDRKISVVVIYLAKSKTTPPKTILNDDSISLYKWVTLGEIKKDKYPLRDPILKPPLMKSLTQKPSPVDTFKVYEKGELEII